MSRAVGLAATCALLCLAAGPPVLAAEEGSPPDSVGEYLRAFSDSTEIIREMREERSSKL